MLSGRLYHAYDPVVVQDRQRAKSFCHAYNTTVREVRNLDFGHPITIQDNAWIGGNVVVVPGGHHWSRQRYRSRGGCDPGCASGGITGGKPNRVIRPLTDADQARWEAEHRE